MGSSVGEDMLRYALMLGFCLALTGCDSCMKELSQEFNKGFVPEFTTSCTDEGVKRGVDRASMERWCRCIAERLVAENDTVKVVTASLNAEGPEFQAMLAQAMKYCGAP